MKQAIVGFLIGFALHFCVVKLTNSDDSDCRPIVSAEPLDTSALQSINTAIIEELGEVNELLYENSDLMQRFSHYTDGHTKVVKFCPECAREEPSIFDDHVVTDGEDTHPEQDVMGDAAEIQLGLRRVTGSLSNQRVTLQRTLSRMRATSPAQDPE